MKQDERDEPQIGLRFASTRWKPEEVHYGAVGMGDAVLFGSAEPIQGQQLESKLERSPLEAGCWVLQRASLPGILKLHCPLRKLECPSDNRVTANAATA